MIGGGYRVRELSSLSEYVAAMGEEHPKTAWNVGGVIELEPSGRSLEVETFSNILAMDQYATEIIYVISEDPLTRKELAKTLSTRLVSKRTA